MDRAFERALAQQKRVEAKFEAERPLTSQEIEAKEDLRLRNETAPMSSSDAIKRMLLASRDKDHFRVMGLDAPGVDAMGRPTWSCTASDVTRAYRKLSALVHPDKNPSSDARVAFEALNEAYRTLKDPGKLSEAMNGQLEAAKRRAAAAESAATPSERLSNYASRREEKKNLQKLEAEGYKSELLEQRKRLQERARRKREAEERINAKRKAEEVLGEDDSEEDDASLYSKQKRDTKRKGKPKLIF